MGAPLVFNISLQNIIKLKRFKVNFVYFPQIVTFKVNVGCFSTIIYLHDIV